MNKSASFREFRYSGSLVGIDLGSHTVKVLQLKVTQGRASVAARAEAEIWKALADAKTESERQAVYVRALKDLLKKAKVKDRKAAIALSGNFSLVKFIKLPKGHKRDPKTGVPEGAKTLSPFDSHDTLLDARDLGAPAEDGSLESMVVVAQRNAIIERIRIVQKAGLRPAVVINDALALENAFNFLRRKDDPGDPVVLLDVGASTTSVNIIEEGRLRASRTFNIAGDAFTRAIRRELDVSAEEAENLKKEYGLFGHRMANDARGPSGANEAYRIYNETSVKVYRALKPSIKDLCQSVQRTIDAYVEKRPVGAIPVVKVVLAGGSSQLRSLEEIMRAELKLPIELFEPLGRNPDGVVSDASSAPLGVAFGLGLAAHLRRQASSPRINLLPGEAKRAAALRNSAAVLILLGLAAAGLWLGHGAYQEHALRVAEEEAKAEKNLKAATPKPKPAPKAAAAPAAPAKPASPFAFLSRLKVSGVFGDVVILDGPGGAQYTARHGKLYDDVGQAKSGVSVELLEKTVVLRGGGETYRIDLPK